MVNGYLRLFFCEMHIQDFCSFFLIGLNNFSLQICENFIYTGYKFIVGYMYGKYLLVCGLLFYFLNSGFDVQICLILMNPIYLFFPL